MPVSLKTLFGKVKINGKDVELTKQEWAIYNTLAARPGYVFTNDELLKLIRSSSLRTCTSNLIGVYVCHLRIKLGAEIIRTIRGKGYCLGSEVTR